MASPAKKTTVLFISKVREELQHYLTEGVKDFQSVNLIFRDSIDDERLYELAPSADIIVGWRPPDNLLEQADNLSLFINPGAGVQHQVDRFRSINENRRVTLVNGHGNSYFTAQHTVALLLALTNKVIPHHNWMTAGEWRKGDTDGKSIPLRDRHIGLLGYGAVNRKVHQFLSGFDLRFSALKTSWNILQDNFPTELRKQTPEDLTEFLNNIDILLISLPHTSRSEGLIDMEELRLLGKDGLLVNVGRGIVIDEESLYLALKENIIKGAALDVWYDYKPVEDDKGQKYPYNFPFHELDNVVLSPHRAASPFDDLKRWDEVIENIRRFAQGRTDFLNVVNLEREY